MATTYLFPGSHLVRFSEFTNAAWQQRVTIIAQQRRGLGLNGREDPTPEERKVFKGRATGIETSVLVTFIRDMMTHDSP